MSGLSRMARIADYQLTLPPTGEAGKSRRPLADHSSVTISHFAFVMMPVELRRLFIDGGLVGDACQSQERPKTFEVEQLRGDRSVFEKTTKSQSIHFYLTTHKKSVRVRSAGAEWN